MSMELILSPQTVEITQGIKNKEQLEAELADQLEYYKYIVVTEDNMKDAKSDRASLNKLRKAIDDQRKSVKKQFEGLYKPFEADCRELIAMIDEPIGMIDKQVAALDEVRKKEKYEAVGEFFSKICSFEFVKIEDVLNPKWENKTMKLDKLKEEVSENVQRIADDYAEIRKLYADSPMLTAIIQRFEQTLDKGAALAYAAEIERKEKQERGRQEAAASTSAPAADSAYKMYDKPEPKGRVTFTVTGTKAQIIALREFLKANGLAFEVVR